jgi:hypothetical protein
MPEPTTSTGAGGAALVAIAASLVGSKYGPFATVAAAALIGAFISLGEVGTGGRLAAARYLLLYTGAAAVTAGALAYLIELFTHIPAIEILVLVAFCIGWIGGRWQGLLNSALAGAQKLLNNGTKRGGTRK